MKPPWMTKPFHDAVERGAVVDARLREPQELPHVVRRAIRKDFDA
jgi:hypothetical protein